jgi:hypothetical protein
MDDTRSTSAAEGEWECDECGHIIPGRGNKPPTGKCPDCGEPAEDSFTFYPYDDDDWDDESDDELDEDYSGEDDEDA